MNNHICLIFTSFVFYRQRVSIVISFRGLGYRQSYAGVSCIHLVMIARRQRDIVTGPGCLGCGLSLEFAGQLNYLPFIDCDSVWTLEDFSRNYKENGNKIKFGKILTTIFKKKLKPLI